MVTDSITVQVSNPGAVRVTKNGTPVKFDTKTAGIGSVTIKGTKPESEAKDTDESVDANTGNTSADNKSTSKKEQVSSQKSEKKSNKTTHKKSS